MALIYIIIFLAVLVVFYYFYKNYVKPYIEDNIIVPQIRRKDDNYKLLARNTNKICTQYPEVIFQPRTTKDLALLVTKYDSLTVRSCGNCFAKWSSSNKNLIDMSLFSSIVMMYPRNKDDITTVVVEPGVTYESLYNYLHKEGYTIAGSPDLYRGVVVQSMTDGYGYLTRKYGPLVDNVVAYKLVLADGRDIICPDKMEHLDLFQALKGYGPGNFGIVTQVFIKAIKLPQVVTVFMYNYTFSCAAEVISWFTSEKRKLVSKRITCKLFITSHSVQIKGLFLGKETDKHFVRIKFPKTKTYDIEETTYEEAFDKLKVSKLFSSIKGKTHYGSGELSQEAINLLLTYCRDIHADFTVEFQQLGETQRFREKNHNYLLTYYITFDKISSPINWSLIQLDALYSKMLKYTSPYSSMSFMDEDVEDYLTAYYGGKKNVKKLREIKNRYDPDNLFSYPQGLNYNVISPE